MGKKEKKETKKVKRTSLITNIIVYTLIYITILIIGGEVINYKLEENKKLANSYKNEENKDDERTENLFSSQDEYSKSLEKLKETKKKRDDAKSILDELKNKDGENIKKIEDLDKQIKAYTPEKEKLESNKNIVKSEFDKLNKKFIDLNEEYQESLKQN